MSTPEPPAEASGSPESSTPPTSPWSGGTGRPGVSANRLPGRKWVKRGVLPTRMMRVMAFAVISLSVLACAVLCLLAVWDYASGDTAWRAFASLGIISGAMLLLVMVNEVFGQAVHGEPRVA